MLAAIAALYVALCVGKQFSSAAVEQFISLTVLASG